MIVTQSCPTLCDPIDSNLPGSSVRGASPCKKLEWVAVPFSRESSWHRDKPEPRSPALQVYSLSSEPPGKPRENWENRGDIIEIENS